MYNMDDSYQNLLKKYQKMKKLFLLNDNNILKCLSLF